MCFRNAALVCFLTLTCVVDLWAQTCPNGFCSPPARAVASTQLGAGLGPVHGNAQAFAHCRIYVGDGTVGSGTLIARNDTTGLVLTCSHLFDQGASNIVVAFADGSRYAANLIDRDPANDLAALVIRRPNAQPVVVCDENVTGGVLTACGYGSTGAFRPASGAIVGHAQVIGVTVPSVKIMAAVRPGDGVLDGAGRLVGVVWGCRDGETYLTCGRPLREFLDRVWQGRRGQKSEAEGQSPTVVGPQPPALSLQLAARFGDIETAIADLRANKQDRGEYVRAGDLDDYAKSSDVPATEAIFQRIEERIQALRPGLLSGMSMARLIAGALGLSSPVALAVIVAGGLVGRRLRKGVDITRGRRRPGSPAIPVAIDSPPPLQQTVPETHYVPVEKDDFARAHQWASAQVARKYPGAAELLTTLDSLIKQQLAGSA